MNYLGKLLISISIILTIIGLDFLWCIFSIKFYKKFKTTFDKWSKNQNH